MKKVGIFLGALAMGVVGLFVLSEKATRGMSYDDVYAARKKAFDEGNESLFKAYDWEINRRDNDFT